MSYRQTIYDVIKDITGGRVFPIVAKPEDIVIDPATETVYPYSVYTITNILRTKVTSGLGTPAEVRFNITIWGSEIADVDVEADSLRSIIPVSWSAVNEGQDVYDEDTKLYGIGFDYLYMK